MMYFIWGTLEYCLFVIENPEINSSVVTYIQPLYSSATLASRVYKKSYYITSHTVSQYIELLV